MRTLKIKLLSFLLVAALLVAMVPFAALAETATTVTDSASLIAAVANGGEITLEGTVTLFETVYVTKDTVINLNDNAINIDNNHIVDVFGSEVKNLFVVSGATLTINGGENNSGVVEYNGTGSPFKLEGVEDKDTKLILNNGYYAAHSRYDSAFSDFLYAESIVEIDAAFGTKKPSLEINGGSYSVMLNTTSSAGKIITGIDENVSITAGIFGSDVTKYVAESSVTINREDGGCVVYDIVEEPSEDIKAHLNDKGEFVAKRYAPETEEDIFFMCEWLYFYFYEALEDESIWFITEAYNMEESYIYAEVSDKATGNVLYTFKMPIVFEYDETVKPQIDAIIESLPKGEETPEGFIPHQFSVNDLELINYWLTCSEDDDNINALINYSDEFKKYIGYKNFLIDTRYGDDDYFYTAAGGIAEFKYDGTVYGTANLAVLAQHIIYVPDNTENTAEALLKAAQDRIDAYLGKDKVTLQHKGAVLEVMLREHYENTRPEWEGELGADATYEEWKQSSYYRDIDVESATGIEGVTDDTPAFTTTINGVTYNLLIMKNSSKMVTPKYQNVDFQSNITVSSADASVPLDTMLQVKKLESGEEYDRIISVLKPEASESFDIRLYSDSTDKYVNKLSNGKFKLRIPIPDDFKGKELKVYYVGSDNKAEAFETIVESNYAVITTNHFSIYTLTATDTFTETESPKTQDNTNNGLWISLSLVSGIMLLATIYNKKRFEN